MSKKLTPEYVVMRTKCDRLEKLKNLNLWGCDLEDITVLRQIPNLEVVSLSVNRIKSLKEFGTLKQLKELYLRKNFVSDISEIKFLEKCPNLKVLWLSENPIADTKNYRKIVLKSLPNLTKLDDNIVTADERSKAIEGGDDEDNYGDGNEDGNKSSDSMDPPKEENVFETKNFYNKNIPATTTTPTNINANKFSNNNANDNAVYKKNSKQHEDNIENEPKSNFNFVKEKKTSNAMQHNNDMYQINDAKKVIKEKPGPISSNKYNYDNEHYEEPVEPKKVIKEKPGPISSNKYNYDNPPYEEPVEPKKVIREKPGTISNKYSYDNQPYEEPVEPKKVIKEKQAPISSNRNNYDNQTYEERNVVEKFENLNIGGGITNNVYTKKNDLRRENRPNIDMKNNDSSYNNSEGRNEFRNDLNKKNSIKADNYNETLREFNNLNSRKSIENIPTKHQNINSSTNRSSNVMNCVVMLLKELNDYDLEIVRDEINQKLGNK